MYKLKFFLRRKKINFLALKFSKNIHHLEEEKQSSIIQRAKAYVLFIGLLLSNNTHCLLFFCIHTFGRGYTDEKEKEAIFLSLLKNGLPVDIETDNAYLDKDKRLRNIYK